MAINQDKGICLMAQINSTNLPEYVPETRLAGTKVRTNNETSGSVAAPLANAPQDDLQLTKLSSVLNSLKRGAFAMRSQLTQVMGAVQNGTYEIDPLQVSKSIVGESLASR
jgi:anti-sigma28 factor (negative regulator of flagellin synthesis)